MGSASRGAALPVPCPLRGFQEERAQPRERNLAGKSLRDSLVLLAPAGLLDVAECSAWSQEAAPQP